MHACNQPARRAVLTPHAHTQPQPQPHPTGLDIEKDTIIEIAVLVTDGDLKKVVEGPSIVIHHPEAVIEGMNEWSKEHHGKSGLTQKVRESMVSMEEAEAQVRRGLGVWGVGL